MTANATAKQEGQWKVLLWGGGIFASFICLLLTMNYNSQQHMSESIKGMNTDLNDMKTEIRAYIAGNKERQNIIIETLEDHEARLRAVEYIHK